MITKNVKKKTIRSRDKTVMKTLRRLMDEEEEDMDYEEAADAAVDRRKLLLNRIFQPWPGP